MTGKKKWWVAGLANETCATPVYGEDRLYFYATHELGESEFINRVPPFKELLAKWDLDRDEKISTEEIPEDFALVSRHFSGRGIKVGDFLLRDWLLYDSREKVIKFNEADWAKQMVEIDKFMAEFSATEPKAFGVRCGGEGDVTASHLVWTEKKGLPQVASELLYRGRLYFIKNDGFLTVRDPINGKTIFQDRIGTPGGYYASPIAGGGLIYTASDRGVVTVIEAADTLKVLARNDLREPIVATPALVDGKLYVRTANHLFAFDKGR